MDLTDIGEKTICGIIGRPLGHTLSPIMHNAAFKELGLDYVYLTFEIHEEELGKTLNILKEKNFRGLSVTHPFKIKVMEYLDVMDEMAEEIGAVNTIVNNEGKLVGYNTDSFGALEAMIRNHVDIEKGGKKILILGAGGAARALTVPLVKMGNEVIIVNRTHQRGEELAMMLKKLGEAEAKKMDEIGNVVDDVEILINCTPVGMKGGPESSPLPTQLIRNDIIVFDMVYSPKDTPLLLAAKEVGAKVIYGYEMFIHQGAKAFELWTGENAPVEVMRKIVLGELGGREI
jgi:shikimate dehydrogenase